jgi:hypothetical protein
MHMSSFLGPRSLAAAITANDLMAVRHHVTIVGSNIDEGDSLLYAVSRDLHDIAAFLISCGANCNMTDQMGTTPLHYAARLNNVVIMQELINAGANAAACDKAGLAPIHLAALYGWHEAVECLLKAAADPLVCTPLGVSPTGLALRSLLRRTKRLFTTQTTLGEIIDYRFDVKLMSSELRIRDPGILNIAFNPQVKRLQRVIQLLEVSLFYW